MAIAFVQAATQVTVDAASGTVSITLNGVTAGNALVFMGQIYNLSTGFTISGVSDGAAYTVRSALFTQVTDRQYSVVGYRVGVAANDYTVTATLSGATALQTFAELGLAEFSGVATSSEEDTFDGNDDISITSTDVSAGPITTTDAGDLLVGCGGVVTDSSTSLAWASPTSWTNLYRKNDGFTSGTGMDAGYWLPGSIQTTYTAQWAHRNITGNEGSAVVVALKPAAGGGATTDDPLLHMREIYEAAKRGIRAIGSGWKRHADGRLLVPAYPIATRMRLA